MRELSASRVWACRQRYRYSPGLRRSHRPRLRLCVHRYVGEDALGHFYCLTAAVSTGERFDLNCDWGPPHLNDFRITAHLVSDEDWTLKAHCSDCDSDNSTVCASDGDGAASEIHLRQEPAAKNISMRIGKHGHSNRPQRQLRFRRRFGRVPNAHWNGSHAQITGPFSVRLLSLVGTLLSRPLCLQRRLRTLAGFAKKRHLNGGAGARTQRNCAGWAPSRSLGCAHKNAAS